MEQKLADNKELFEKLISDSSNLNGEGFAFRQKLKRTENVLVDNFFVVNEENFTLLSDAVKVSKHIEAERLDPWEVGVRIKEVLVLKQQDLLLLKEYSSSKLANLLHHSTLNIEALPLDFYIQLNNRLELLFTPENSVLTLVTFWVCLD